MRSTEHTLRASGGPVGQQVDIPLVVDLDGTLVRTDVLYESLIRLLRKNPVYLVLLPLWLVRGRAHLKRQIARRAPLDVGELPYHEEFLVYLTDQARAGRRLILAAGTDALVAGQVAAHVGLFDSVVATDGAWNLTGRRKAERLAGLLGDEPFAYAGDSWVDLPVWRMAYRAIVVSSDGRLVRRVARSTPIEAQFPSTGSTARQLLRALRINQWVKNSLVFVPLLAAHRLDAGSLVLAALAFVAFSLVASAGYLINDLLDVEADRRHAQKRRRPFAAGTLDLRIGFVSAPLLALAGIALGLALSPTLALTLLAYLTISGGYSAVLKRIAIVDVFVLALLYATRIVAGAVAVDVPISQWLLAFSVFLFLSLAFVKRYAELQSLKVLELDRSEGRGYVVADFPILASLGIAGGFVAALVLALYVNSPEVEILYRTPEILWLVCLVLVYWVSRIWIIANRGDLREDPIVFALRDRTSHLALAVCAAAVGAAWLVR